MQAIQVIIVDDEPLARSLLKNYLSAIPECRLAGECGNGFEAVKLIQSVQPDLVLLDVQMPRLTGFEMLELLESPPAVIFCTAYDEYAMKAFDVNAVDYLLKPVSKDRFEKAIRKFLASRGSGEQSVTDGRTLDALQGPMERIVIRDNARVFIIPLTEISWIEAQDDYVRIHSVQGKFMKKKTMKYFEDRLPSSTFIRIHRSCIVNISFVKRLEVMEKDSYTAILNSGTALPVSRAGYDKLKQVFQS